MTGLPQDKRELKNSIWITLLERMGIYVAVLCLLLIGLVFTNDFLTLRNFNDIFNQLQYLGIVVGGAAFITYSGKMADLSIPGTMMAGGFAMIFGLQFGFPIALAMALTAGLTIGLINGLVIGYLKLNPIIWTLAMNFSVLGLIQLIFKGEQVYPDNVGAGATFLGLSQGPLPFVVLVSEIVMLSWVMKNSRFGKAAQLTGSSEDVAATTGVNTGKLTTYIFMLSGTLTALAGVFYASAAKTVTYETGLGYDFRAVTAIVIGGISLQGGKGYMTGALGGLLFITLLENIMSSTGASLQLQELTKGFIFILVVGINARMSTKAGKS